MHDVLPQKIVDIISIIYQNFECSVLMERNKTNSSSVRSSVRQGCILSPILFNIALYYIMRHITQNNTEQHRTHGMAYNEPFSHN